MTTNNKPTVINAEVAKNLNDAVGSVLGNENLEGFERAYKIADAITRLSEILTPEYMKPIMAMQGNKLGFKTDKDKTGGYPESVVNIFYSHLFFFFFGVTFSANTIFH